MKPTVRAALPFVLLLALAPGCAHDDSGPYVGPSPVGRGGSRVPDLVEVVKLDPTLRIDVRYASTNNFLGEKVYPEARVFLQREVAAAVVRANARVRAQGFGLLLFDGYRPWTVTRLFWDRTKPELRNFVADPAKGSKHNRGAAVDLSLYDLRTGEEVRMPTPYDDFTPSAAADAESGTAEERRLRAILRVAMEAEGFSVNEDEWWHFDHATWEQYPIQDQSFAEILARGG